MSMKESNRTHQKHWILEVMLRRHMDMDEVAYIVLYLL